MPRGAAPGRGKALYLWIAALALLAVIAWLVGTRLGARSSRPELGVSGQPANERAVEEGPPAAGELLDPEQPPGTDGEGGRPPERGSSPGAEAAPAR